VFLTQGIVVGVLGNFSGLIAAMISIRYRNEFKQFLASALHIEIFPPSIYQFTELPAKIVASDVAITSACAIVLCSLAAFIPAYVAARLDPVKALRYE
jgi:lipoprotein-releasing system permease protein